MGMSTGVLTVAIVSMVTLLPAAAASPTSAQDNAHPCPIDVTPTAVCIEDVKGDSVICFYAYEDTNGDGNFDHGEPTAVSCHGVP